MSEMSSIKAQVYVPGKSSSRLQRQLTLEVVVNWIKIQGLDEYTTQGLIEIAEKYPTQALPSFRKNFNLMIERVRQKRRQELRGKTPENQKEIENGKEETQD